MATAWRNDRPDDASWRPRAGLNQAQRSYEQDDAAGGHDRRVISLPDGQTAVSSVCLRLPPRARRVYAYIRWSNNGKTSERYVGEVYGVTREENLIEAWRIARERRL